MSAERIFLSHFPRARLERQRELRQGVYYLVRLPGKQMWSGCGDTKAQARRDACDRYNLTAVKS